jgi:uncharacterized damage-inducible protein DinB
MSAEAMRDLYDYHRWANRRLFDEAVQRGAEALDRDLGSHWSVPTVRRMFAHVYGADWLWLARWKGSSPTSVPGAGADIPSMAALRERWDALEAEQRAFVEALADADLGRVIDYRNTEGKPFRATLGHLLPHVPNHATHHRSEIATMLTIISGSPRDTGMNTWSLVRSGQA